MQPVVNVEVERERELREVDERVETKKASN